MPAPPQPLRAPPPGFKWHRADGWTPEMLPDGYRPLLEKEVDGKMANDVEWAVHGNHFKILVNWYIVNDGKYYRTRRPLPDYALGWLPHTPGPCPVVGETTVEVKLKNGVSGTQRADRVIWGERGDLTVIAYRIKPDEPPKRDAGACLAALERTLRELIKQLPRYIGRREATNLLAMLHGGKEGE